MDFKPTVRRVPPTRQTTTLDQVQPGDEIWTGESWTTIDEAAQPSAAQPGSVLIRRHSGTAPGFTTPFRAGRQVALRTLQ